MWVVLTYRDRPALDTGLFVVRVTQPPIATPESTTVIGGMSLAANPRLAGFLGRAHGTVQITSDSAVNYTAPNDFSGVDTVRAVLEGDFHAVVIRDTPLFRFVVLPRATRPAYAVVPVLASDSPPRSTSRG